jgi:hypothetical protein
MVRWHGWRRWLGGGFVLIELLAPLPPREPYSWRRNKGRVQLACKKLGSGRVLDEKHLLARCALLMGWRASTRFQPMC